MQDIKQKTICQQALTFEQKKSICDAMPGGEGYDVAIDLAKVNCYQSLLGKPDASNHDISISAALVIPLLMVGVVLAFVKLVVR